MSAPEITAHRLGPVASVPVGEGRAFAVGEEQVAVFRTRDGGLHATAARCPHAGGPLADGQVDAVKVVCPLHNHVFTFTDGSCPTGDLTVRVFRVRDDDGQLVVEV